MTTTEVPAGPKPANNILADTQRRVGVNTLLPWLTPRQIIDISLALDVLIVFVSFLLAESLYNTVITTPLLANGDYTLVAGFAALVHFAVSRNIQPTPQPFKSTSLSHTLRRLLLTFTIVIVVGYGLKQAEVYSRLWFALSFVIAFAVMAAKTWLLQILIKTRELGDFVVEKIALYGDPAMAMQTKAGLEGELRDLCKISIYDANKPGGDVLNELIADGLNNKFSRVIFCLPAGQMDRLRDLFDAINYLPVRIDASIANADAQVLKKNLLVARDQFMICLDERPQDGWGVFLKRGMDLVFGTALLVLVAPIIGVAALAIKLESTGPVFFRQRRHGWNHSIITVWKLRSMTVQEDGDTIRQAVKNDTRVTRVGAFLRKTSLDELPQLYNVLNGEMSLVGPRPHALAHNVQYSELIAGYAARHKVKPGITGWAQINGLRGNSEDISDMVARAEADIWYIRHWSLLLDLKILFLTPFTMLFHKNAY